MQGFVETIEIVRSILHYPFVKLGVGIGFSLAGFFFDGVLAMAMWALLFLIVFDFITAVWAVVHEGGAIESKKVGKTVKKIVIYYIAISGGFLTETATHQIVPLIDETVIAFLAITELISILENMGRLGYNTPNVLLNRLRSIRDEQ